MEARSVEPTARRERSFTLRAVFSSRGVRHKGKMNALLDQAFSIVRSVTWWQLSLTAAAVLVASIILIFALEHVGIIAPIILSFSVLHIRLEELRQKHGNFFKMWAGWKRFYIINDPAGIPPPLTDY